MRICRDVEGNEFFLKHGLLLRVDDQCAHKKLWSCLMVFGSDFTLQWQCSQKHFDLSLVWTYWLLVFMLHFWSGYIFCSTSVTGRATMILLFPTRNTRSLPLVTSLLGRGSKWNLTLMILQKEGSLYSTSIIMMMLSSHAFWPKESTVLLQVQRSGDRSWWYWSLPMVKFEMEMLNGWLFCFNYMF